MKRQIYTRKKETKTGATATITTPAKIKETVAMLTLERRLSVKS